VSRHPRLAPDQQTRSGALSDARRPVDRAEDGGGARPNRGQQPETITDCVMFGNSSNPRMGSGADVRPQVCGLAPRTARTRRPIADTLGRELRESGPF
jgi:hypothetical protein